MQSLLDGYRDRTFLPGITNGDVADIWARGLTSVDLLDANEKRRFWFTVLNEFLHMQHFVKLREHRLTLSCATGYRVNDGALTGQDQMKNRKSALLFLALVLCSALACADSLQSAKDAHGAGNYQEALRLYKELAERGHADAQYRLGLMYDYGEGVPKDNEAAVVWLRKSAEQGNADAQELLGWMYDNGKGVPEDDKEAIGWYRKAAEQGHVSAQYLLGLRYDSGEGIPEDDKEAIGWYREAAEQGHADAQYRLGLKYESGEGVPKDLVLTYMWFNIAGANGWQAAQFRRQELSESMSPAQIEQAQELSRKCFAQNYKKCGAWSQ